MVNKAIIIIEVRLLSNNLCNYLQQYWDFQGLKNKNSLDDGEAVDILSCLYQIVVDFTAGGQRRILQCQYQEGNGKKHAHAETPIVLPTTADINSPIGAK